MSNDLQNLFEKNGNQFLTLGLFAEASYATKNNDDSQDKKDALALLNQQFGIFDDLDNLSENTILNGEFSFKNASAFVKKIDNNLMIAFRGTDDSQDMLDDLAGVASGNFNRHYKKFDIFINLIDQYIEKNHIANVYVTGHSLGGAMADNFLKTHQNTETTKFLGVTFASPSYQKKSYQDQRLTQFEMTSDIVADTFNNFGNIVNLDDHISGKSIKNHGIANYVNYLTDLYKLNSQLDFNSNTITEYKINILNQQLKEYNQNINTTLNADNIIFDLTQFDAKNITSNNKIINFNSTQDTIKIIYKKSDFNTSDIKISSKKIQIGKNFNINFNQNVKLTKNKNLILESINFPQSIDLKNSVAINFEKNLNIIDSKNFLAIL